MAEQSPRAYVRNPEVISSEAPDAIVALHVDSGDCYSFSGPSARLWALLEQPVTEAEAVAALVREFAIDEAACLAEVEAYLAKLEREGLARAVEAG